MLKPELLNRLLTQEARRPAAPSVLTDRECEVLRAAACGDRSKEIADHLSITERTVKAHLTSIYNKLGVDSRAAAVAVAARRGLLDEADS